MTPQRRTRTDDTLAELAAAQHGVVAWWQLRDRSVTRDAVRVRMERGSLRPVHRGVYAVGWTAGTRAAACMAATLAVGPDAWINDLTALTLYGLRRDPWPPIHVAKVTTRNSAHRGVVVHRIRGLDAADRHVLDGIPVVGMPRALIDGAAHLKPTELARTVERVPRLDARTMRRALDRHAGRAGTGRLDRLLRAYEDPTRSFLERAFLAVCRRHGIVKPAVNTRIAGAERDFAWPDARLVIETDGNAFHASRAQRNADARRDLALGRAGWRVHRLTYEQVVLDPSWTADQVRSLLLVRG